MSDGEKILYLSQELNTWVNEYHARMDGLINRERLLEQSLHGVQISMQNVISQAELVVKIEKEFPE